VSKTHRYAGVATAQEVRMEIREAQNIVKSLAQGVDPSTGEAFAEEST
jgi:hypothetical protein